jgi:hypothetical protein
MQESSLTHTLKVDGRLVDGSEQHQGITNVTALSLTTSILTRCSQQVTLWGRCVLEAAVGGGCLRRGPWTNDRRHRLWLIALAAVVHPKRFLKLAGLLLVNVVGEDF